MDEINRIKEVFGTLSKALEIFYVLKGVKKICRMSFPEEDISRIIRFCNQQGLQVVLSNFKVKMEFDNTYSSKGFKVPRDSNVPGHVFLYIGKDVADCELGKTLEEKDYQQIFQEEAWHRILVTALLQDWSFLHLYFLLLLCTYTC